MPESLSKPRDIAIQALRDRQGNVSAYLEKLLGRESLSPPDEALARELALGSLRRRATLESILRAFLNQPDKRLPSPVTEIFHVAIYQMVFLERIPAFAAVNEAVEQVARWHHRRQNKLVNGVLRAIARDLGEPQEGDGTPAPDVIPLGPRRYRRIQRAVFPDPSDEPARHLAQAFSLPESLAERWLQRQGSLEAAGRLAMHANVRAPLIVRVNRLRGEAAQVRDVLRAAGVQAELHANGVSLVLGDRGNVGRLQPFLDGQIQPQDPTATAVVLDAGVRPGMRVLDFCAAPGTKTTHLAELMRNEGEITALDISEGKLARIRENCRRLGVSIVETRLAEAAGGLPLGGYDLALVDVPCSNTGVLARRAEARWRFDPAKLGALAQDQFRLAAAASQFVRPGGKVIYSTCSIEPEECQQVAKRLGERLDNLRLIDEKLTLPAGAGEPAQWRDGGYMAHFEVR